MITSRSTTFDYTHHLCVCLFSFDTTTSSYQQEWPKRSIPRRSHQQFVRLQSSPPPLPHHQWARIAALLAVCPNAVSAYWKAKSWAASGKWRCFLNYFFCSRSTLQMLTRCTNCDAFYSFFFCHWSSLFFTPCDQLSLIFLIVMYTFLIIII